MTTAAPQDKKLDVKRKTLPELLNDENHQKNFTAMLGKDARSFAQNILTVYNGSTSLQQCDPESIIAACAISASINLSILPSLGQSCVVPYKDGDRLVAQWQIQWKGLVALAHRTKLYSKIHLARIYEGQLVHASQIEGEFKFNEGAKKSDRVVGYYFYFKLIGSDEKYAYFWTAKQCIEHGLRYSKSFQKGNGSKWSEDPEYAKAGNVQKWLALPIAQQFLTEGSGADAMSAKTIVKNCLNKWGPLETRIKELAQLDQAVIAPDGTPKYIDTTAEPVSDKTYTQAPTPSGQEPSPAEKLLWAKDAAKKQGVSNETFDTWVRQQPGNEAAIAEAATAAWKRVAIKEITATEAFKVKDEAEFEVSSVAKTDVGGEDAWVIKDTADPVVKYFTNQEPIAEAGKIAKADKTKLSVLYEMRGEGKNAYRWITAKL